MKRTLSVVIAMVVVTGCKDDTSGPSRSWTNDSPGISYVIPTIQNIWPNVDQTAWSFEYEWEEIADWTLTLYPRLEDVPPLPGWDDVNRFLDMPLIADSVTTVEATYGMRFNGERTAGGGVTAQNLEISYRLDGAGKALVKSNAPAESEFIRRLLVARPDLEPKLSHLVSGRDVAVGQSVRNPLFVHGGVWEKTAEWIGTYGDLDRLLAWKFLTDDLDPGSEFSHQLVPSLAHDVYLHCRIVREVHSNTSGGKSPKAIECHYLLDYGISTVYDVELHLLGYYRAITYGSVVYAPEVGPVYCFERPLAGPDDPVGVAEIKLTLTDFLEPTR